MSDSTGRPAHADQVERILLRQERAEHEATIQHLHHRVKVLEEKLNEYIQKCRDLEANLREAKYVGEENR